MTRPFRVKYIKVRYFLEPYLTEMEFQPSFLIYLNQNDRKEFCNLTRYLGPIRSFRIFMLALHFQKLIMPYSGVIIASETLIQSIKKDLS